MSATNKAAVTRAVRSLQAGIPPWQVVTVLATYCGLPLTGSGIEPPATALAVAPAYVSWPYGSATVYTYPLS